MAKQAQELTDRASAIIVAYNHPAGSLERSASDVDVTMQTQGGGERDGDHLAGSHYLQPARVLPLPRGGTPVVYSLPFAEGPGGRGIWGSAGAEAGSNGCNACSASPQVRAKLERMSMMSARSACSAQPTGSLSCLLSRIIGSAPASSSNRTTSA